MHISGQLQVEESKIGSFTVDFITPSAVRIDCEKWITLFRVFRLTSSLKPNQLSSVKRFLKGKTAVVSVGDVERMKIEIDRAGCLSEVLKQLVKSMIGIRSS